MTAVTFDDSILVSPTGMVAGMVAAAEKLVYVDIDDTVRQTCGCAQQGAGRG